ncbi:hypothetical protein SCLCIDRAFT_142241 [Scleroderma citrinum Foug A]|uniref:Uncharacterized protein n=1 Tax=Scleroderma citrinum Foug A TaxID=1036808 RepID=A0A0C2ZGH0_9AGAM|nr:hypothetical protein SCLCIDRAFT_142241 [Scleroderma citrinum Foug A]
MALSKYSFTVDTCQVRLSSLLHPYAFHDSAPPLNDVNSSPAGPIPAHHFLPLCTHETPISDTCFEHLIFSGQDSPVKVTFLNTVKAWKAALDKKRELVASLAKVQSEIEDSEGSIVAVLGEQKTAVYRNDYYFHGCFADESTITGEYKKEVSQITRKPFSWKFDRKKHGVVTFSRQFSYPYTT